MLTTLHDRTNYTATLPQHTQNISVPSLYLKSHKSSSPRARRSYESIAVRRPGCTHRVRRTSRVSSRGPHCRVCRHFVGANSDSLDNLRRSRHLVSCHSTRATSGSGNRAEQVAAGAICGSRNTSGVLVADSHARLDGVGGGLAAVRRVEGSTGEVLTAVDGVGCAVRVGVVLVAIGRAKSLGWRSDSGGGWGRNSSAATVGWWRIARRAWSRCATAVRRRRVVGRRWARCALSVRRRRVVRKRRCNATAAVDRRTTIGSRHTRLIAVAARD
jgi:hypothetical protein